MPTSPKPSSKTLTTLLLDRSGSMDSLHAQTITAINGWLAELRGSGEDIRLSFIQFDHHGGEICLEKVHVARRITEVSDLAPADFQPRGSTPLIDAAMDTIHAIGKSLEGPRGTGVKVVIAIQTDGWENASRRYRWDDLKAEIERREASGWEFVFMGAGLGKATYQMSARMGISAEKTISYGTDMEETRAAFRATAQNTVRYSAGIMARMAYSAPQKRASGDVDDPGFFKSPPVPPKHSAARPDLGAGPSVPPAAAPAAGSANPFWTGVQRARRVIDPASKPSSDPVAEAAARTDVLSGEISAALDDAPVGGQA